MRLSVSWIVLAVTIAIVGCHEEKPVDRRALTRLLGVVDDTSLRGFREKCSEAPTIGRFTEVTNTQDGRVLGYHCDMDHRDARGIVRRTSSADVRLYRNGGIRGLGVSAHTFEEALELFDRFLAPMLSDFARATLRPTILDGDARFKLRVPGGMIDKFVDHGGNETKHISWSLYTDLPAPNEETGR